MHRKYSDLLKVRQYSLGSSFYQYMFTMTLTTSHNQFTSKSKLTNFVFFPRSDDPDIEFHHLYHRKDIFSHNIKVKDLSQHDTSKNWIRKLIDFGACSAQA